MVLETVMGIIIGLFISYVFFKIKLQHWEEKYKIKLQEWKMDHEQIIKNDVLKRSRAVIKGKISEQLVAMLPDFKYNAADARFIGNPIDYVIFDGYSDESEMQIVFMDVKKGTGKLSKVQQRIKEAVEKKRVRWETLHLE